MKFEFDEIILWSNEYQKRRIKFKKNKVNIITGKSGMGKTSVMKIIDYCLLASTHTIPHSIINENISWYGIKFSINNKDYIICRKSPQGNKVSKEYYFSNIGSDPEIPIHNIDQSELKKILDIEFSITNNTTLSYGGNHLKKDSKISFRFFMLFNTISEDIITNTTQFFDKQNIDRYREALPRIFDLALTIDNVENILNKELKENIQKKISKELQKGEAINNKIAYFDTDKNEIFKECLNYGIDLRKSPNLEKIDYSSIFSEESSKDYEKFSNNTMKLYSTKIKIKRLIRLKNDYQQYKLNLSKKAENLLPIELIKSDNNIPQLPFFSEILDTLSYELKNIKSIISEKQPLDIEIHESITKLRAEELKLQSDIDNYPHEIKTLESFNEIITTIGKINVKNELFNDIPIHQNYNQALINDLNSQLESIDVLNIEHEKELVVSLINEMGDVIRDKIKKSLENYGDWHFHFNYQEKITQLRKPKSLITENVGSSSNHMFLHLLHFLALHTVIIMRRSLYVPSFLIIDQLSRPYYGEDSKSKNNDFITDNSDEMKVHSALKLLNIYISSIKNKLNHDFQIILIEHIPKSYVENYKNFHIVENFDSDNPLIPFSWYK